jgi:uncharacterized membrane protein
LGSSSRSRRSRSSPPCCWLLGLAALTAAFIAASDLLGELREAPPKWASWTRVVLGSALIVFGIYRLLTRRRQTDPPRWMRPFAKLTPVRAGVVGAALAPIRLEVLIVCATAGLAIGTSGFSDAGAWLMGAAFVAISASTVAIPIVAYASAGDRLDDQLTRLKEWMENNHAALEGAIMVVIGLMVLYNGIHALTAG